jgi:hypothetical protein
VSSDCFGFNGMYPVLYDKGAILVELMVVEEDMSDASLMEDV